MKKKQEDGWHVYSEKGKHMGGPYETEEQANKRLQQMEYYKHEKRAEHVFSKVEKDYQNTRIVDDAFFVPLDNIKKQNAGKTFIRTKGAPNKLRYEGFGLEKFKGFKDLDDFKSKYGLRGSFVENVEIPKEMKGVKSDETVSN